MTHSPIYSKESQLYSVYGNVQNLRYFCLSFNIFKLKQIPTIVEKIQKF